MNVWLLLALAGLVSLVLRGGFVLLVGDRSLPPSVERISAHVSPAMLGALVGAALSPVAAEGLDPGLLVVAVVGAVVAFASRSVSLTLLVGITAHLLLQAVPG